MTQPSENVTAGPLVAGGDALVRREGQKTMFVRGALPGEEVRVQITNERKDLAYAEVVEVLAPSEHRIAAPCPMFHAGCGGCQWQYAAANAQADYKVDIVRDALTRIAKVEASVAFAGSVDPYGYRTTLRLAVVDGKAALRARASHDLVPLDVCMIAHPLLGDLIERGGFGDAQDLTLRASESTGERVVWTHGDELTLDLPEDVTVSRNGKAKLNESVAGRNYRLTMRSFFQSGRQAAELLASVVNDAVPSKIDWLIDAYAGIGVLGGTLAAQRRCRITAVEQSRYAVADAKHNLGDLDAEVIEAEVATVSLAGSANPDVIVADPARTGLGPSATKTLSGLGADYFVLVSCDPASLARDVTLLREHGYILNDVQVLDLFPQTHHVETVSRFTR